MSVTRRSLVVASMAGLTGCAAREQWRAVRLDAEPQATTAVTGGGLIVGTPGPGLMGPAGRIAVRPATTYGREAAWVCLAGSTERLAGIGMKRGGGHGNPRWSLFLGSPTALNERPQEFEVFDGWGAGQLIGVAFAGQPPGGGGVLAERGGRQRHRPVDRPR